MSQSPSPDARTARDRAVLLLLLLLAVLLSLGAVWTFDRGNRDGSLLTLGNLVGPTTAALLRGDGLMACTVAMGTLGNPICFHAGRMPVPSLVIAAGVRLLGDRFLPVAFFKAVLLVVPLLMAMALAWRWAAARVTGLRLSMCAVLLLLPFAMTPFLANVVNMQVEEGYAYSLLALPVSLLLFARAGGQHRVMHALIFAGTVDGLYLAKSSMAPAALLLTVGYLLRARSAPLRALVLLLVAAAPLGWALRQHAVSGRYTFGTSIDGENLHKGNNPQFLARYPPPPGESLDRWDPEMNRGLHFNDEWSFNDFHQHAAVAFLRADPQAAARGVGRKLRMIFFSVHKYGSSATHGLRGAAETAGIVVFRLLFWTAIAGSALGMRADDRELRFAGAGFLLLTAACAAPYVVGFAYTRHISVLIYPTVLVCVLLLVRGEGSPRSTI